MGQFVHLLFLQKSVQSVQQSFLNANALVAVQTVKQGQKIRKLFAGKQAIRTETLGQQAIRAFYLIQRSFRKHPGLIIDRVPVNIYEGESLGGDLFFEAAFLF